MIDFVLSEKFITTIVTILFTIIIVSIINRAKDKIEVTNAASIKTKKRNTIVTLISNILSYLFILIALVIILSIWGVDVSAIVTSLGVVGVIGGLALQDALKDIIAGCNIILDDYFVVGDLVTFNDFTGIVSEFGLKSTKIIGFDGTELTIANREISKIQNLSSNPTLWYLNIPVAYEVSEKKVEKVMQSIIKRLEETKLTLETPQYLGVNNFNESNVDYLLLIKCKSEDRYVIRREALKIVKEEFDEKNIKIPYPQVEIHNGK
jgi:small conductance mechanosensitive channel